MQVDELREVRLQSAPIKREPLPDPTFRPEPPKSSETEKGVLAACLTQSQSLPIVLSRLKRGDFYYQHHREVFGAIAALAKAGSRISEKIVRDHLESNGRLDAAGGASGVSDLLDSQPIPGDVPYLCGIVLRKSRARAGLTFAARLTAILSNGRDPGGLLEEYASNPATAPLVAAYGEMVAGGIAPEAAIEPIELVDLSGETTPPRWIIPGYSALGELGVLGADIGVGKTTFIADECISIATGRPHIGIEPAITGPVIYFAEECSADEIKLLFKRLGAGPHPNLCLAAEQGLRLDDPAQVARIEALLDKVRPVFVVFDTWRSILVGDENDSTATEECARVLRQFIRRRNGDLAVEVLHHLRKPLKGERWGLNLLRGSGALAGKAQHILAIRRDPIDPEATQLHRWKRRGRPLRPYWLFKYHEGQGDTSPIRLEGLGPGDDDKVTAPGAKSRAGQLARDVLDERGPLGSPDLCAIGERANVKPRTMQRALSHLVETGGLKQEPGKGGRFYLPGQEGAL